MTGDLPDSKALLARACKLDPCCLLDDGHAGPCTHTFGGAWAETPENARFIRYCKALGLTCEQCGELWGKPACGPTHASIAYARGDHRRGELVTPPRCDQLGVPPWPW